MIPLRHEDGGSHQQAVSEAEPSRVVPKPVPSTQAQDPRRYQMDQLRKRFSPRESTLADGTSSLVFRLRPSDPDFPFELDFLECDIRVPAAYPAEPPTLLVRNRDIPRGFGINVERGWSRLVREQPGSTLLALTHGLDKSLEAFLSEQKVETVKLVTFKDTRHLEQDAQEATSPSSAAAATAALKATAPASAAKLASSPAPPLRPYVPEPSYTREQVAEAKARRAQETRQLEARMGRGPLYRRSADGIVYTLPVEPRRRSELPEGLQGVRTLHLIIPLLYPLQPLRIQLNEAESRDAEGVEELFVEKATEQKHMTLMSHLNYLAQNMHLLAKQAKAAAAEAEPKPEPSEEERGAVEEKGKTAADDGVAGDKSHVKFIPRPPEWTVIKSSEAQDSSDDYSYDSGDEFDADGGAVLGSGAASAAPAAAIGPTPERGTAISFPSIELHGIELLEVSLLSVAVKCERCKTINEVSGLKPHAERSGSCRKCASAFAVTYRPQPVHENSTRVGFLDLSGCTASDMLPSTFVPVCAKCSTPSPGLVSVRGETMTNVCRECHGRFTFKIPEVKLLAITPGSAPPPTSGPRRKVEKLGLHAGDPLPGRGACAHYRKSYRWFRFSCCSRVHPCDRCHDEAEDHVNEWASRMICGWCSREQNYAVEACAFCGRSVIGKKGRGFWEGGRGTRDRVLMSRNDKRKYRRVGGGEAQKKD